MINSGAGRVHRQIRDKQEIVNSRDQKYDWKLIKDKKYGRSRGEAK
jgi:hypothetical protein